jgi:hypothetical protein
MITRLVDVEKDADKVLAGFKDFVSRMDFTEYLPVGEEWWDEYIIKILSVPEIEVIAADDDGRLVAGIGISYTQFLWNPGLVHADELFWWAAEDAPPTAAIRVFKHAMKSIKDAERKDKVFTSFKALTSSPDSVKSLYKRMGLREIETNFVGVF